MNSGNSSVLPSSAKPSMNMRKFAVAKVFSRKRCRSMMGSLWCHSQKMTNISDATEITVSQRMKGDSNQSSRCPLSRTTCSVPSPSATKPSPV